MAIPVPHPDNLKLAPTDVQAWVKSLEIALLQATVGAWFETVSVPGVAGLTTKMHKCVGCQSLFSTKPYTTVGAEHCLAVVRAVVDRTMDDATRDVVGEVLNAQVNPMYTPPASQGEVAPGGV